MKLIFEAKIAENKATTMNTDKLDAESQSAEEIMTVAITVMKNDARGFVKTESIIT